ncbi:MAG: WbuC family cupin fold metalloprotein [Mariprofundaceae bacterium]|nr:WbuC family cupin fold metalloprotein [Mariprofundaceae bacterium]
MMNNPKDSLDLVARDVPHTGEAAFSFENILALTPEHINDIKRRAKESPRQRYRLCMHHSLDDQIQEMVIAGTNDTYMPPHRHPKGKSESYHMIEGTMTVYFFNDEGEVIHTLEIGDANSGKPCLYRLSSNEWHMPVPNSEWVVYHECYVGPFDREHDMELASWAPHEKDYDGVQVFLNKLSLK